MCCLSHYAQPNHQRFRAGLKYRKCRWDSSAVQADSSFFNHSPKSRFFLCISEHTAIVTPSSHPSFPTLFSCPFRHYKHTRRAAKVRGGGKPVPTLARPPGHSGKSGASSESPEKKESSVDLLSGFELEGTSLGSSKGSSGEAAAAAPSPAVGADLFADFAAPSAAGGGGVSGGTGGNGIVAQVPQEGVVSAGVHGERGRSGAWMHMYFLLIVHLFLVLCPLSSVLCSLFSGL